jgi:Zn-dependent protease with chaperone function
MYDKCKGNADVLYFLIGQEIGHTERGHSKLNILEGQLYNMTRRGNNARSDTAFFPLSASPSNQRFEFEADYYGINLVNELQKDLCATVSFWKEMARDENEYDTFEGMFRTHPFSSQRAECLQVHLQHNFGINCSAR